MTSFISQIAALILPKIPSQLRRKLQAAHKSLSSVPPSPTQPCPHVKTTPSNPSSLTIGRPEDYSGPMRKRNAELLRKATRLQPESGPLKVELDAFAKHYEKNKIRYESVASKTSFPPQLIAAMHWREGSGRFDTMMSNGSPLGKKSTIVPYDGPYSTWEDSAVAMLNDPSRQKLRKTVGLDKSPTDLVALASIAETWNGSGYFNKGLPSPYTFSGTDVYTKGKYVKDRVFDPDVVDQQIGIVPMLVRLMGNPSVT
jgi:lysozyme family protein